MSNLSVARTALRAQLQSIIAEQKKLRGISETLEAYSQSMGRVDGVRSIAAYVQGLPAGRLATAPGPDKSSARRKRLKGETARDIRDKIVKAAKAYGSSGAARGDVIKYLDTNGYRVGHHYTDANLNRMIADLLDASQITRQGERSKARYFVGQTTEVTPPSA